LARFDVRLAANFGAAFVANTHAAQGAAWLARNRTAKFCDAGAQQSRRYCAVCGSAVRFAVDDNFVRHNFEPQITRISPIKVQKICEIRVICG
jgi:hypothetical protein